MCVLVVIFFFFLGVAGEQVGRMFLLSFLGPIFPICKMRQYPGLPED